MPKLIPRINLRLVCDLRKTKAEVYVEIIKVSMSDKLRTPYNYITAQGSWEIRSMSVSH